MKIIHINFAKTWRGGERQVFLLMQGLQKKEIEQVLICRSGSALEKEAKQAGFTVHPQTQNFFLKIFQTRILYTLAKKGYQIIHCHESKAHTFGIIGKVFWKTNQQLIVHRRVIFPIKKKPTTAFKYSEKHLAKIICISKAVEESVKKSIGFQNTVVVPSMIDLKDTAPIESGFREKWNITAQYLVGYIAALTSEKDHYTFLNTAKQILNISSLDVHFVIIGEGRLETDLIDYAEKLGIKEKVTFTGFVQDVQKIIPEIDVLLFTSISEGLGTTILDFFLAKRPVIATKSGGAEELIIDGKTGFLCEAGDHDTLAERTTFLLENPAINQSIVQEARKFTDKFSTTYITERTLEVYKSVL